jgi:hypothetical protein
MTGRQHLTICAANVGIKPLSHETNAALSARIAAECAKLWPEKAIAIQYLHTAKQARK